MYILAAIVGHLTPQIKHPHTHTFALARGYERGVTITPHLAPSKSQVYGAHAGQTEPTYNKRYDRNIEAIPSIMVI